MVSLLEQHRSQIEALCREHHVVRLDVFGSAATGAFDAERSDVDLLVEFADPMPTRRFRAYFALKGALEDLFGRPVDLIEPGGIRNKYYRRGIEETRERLYAA